MVITSKQNPLIKDISKLISDKKYRVAAGQFVVEGVKPVRECLAAGCAVEKILCTESYAEEFPQAQVLSDGVFNSLSTEKMPQGVMAVVKLPENELIKPRSACLLLDRLQDPGNLGTIIRTANAAGYDDVYLINCTDAYSPKAVRASMSGVFFVRLHCGTEEEILRVLEGVPLICADMDGENIFDFAPPKNFCLCIGNEGGGLSDSLMAAADFKVKIPMRESCESLNAAISAGIAMYQLKNKEV